MSCVKTWGQVFMETQGMISKISKHSLNNKTSNHFITEKGGRLFRTVSNGPMLASVKICSDLHVRRIQASAPHDLREPKDIHAGQVQLRKVQTVPWVNSYPCD